MSKKKQKEKGEKKEKMSKKKQKEKIYLAQRKGRKNE